MHAVTHGKLIVGHAMSSRKPGSNTL